MRTQENNEENMAQVERLSPEVWKGIAHGGTIYVFE